jgi:cell division protein FtsA
MLKVAIDIGTSEIKGVSFLVDAEKKALAGHSGVQLLNFARVPSQGVRKGTIVHHLSAAQAVTAVIDELQVTAGSEIPSVYATISGNHMKGMESVGVIPVRSFEVRPSDVVQVLESARMVIVPADREIVHTIPQEFRVDDQDGFEDPVGIAGARLEARTYLITGAASCARTVVKCINATGRRVENLLSAALCSSESVLSKEERELGVILLDIGSGTTDLVGYYRGALRILTVLPVGGAHVTSDLAVGLRTPLIEAERLKKQFGVASSSALEEERSIEVPSMGKRPSRLVPQYVLADLIEPRLREVFQLLRKELIKTGFIDTPLAGGIVITGGTAHLPGIVRVTEEEFGMPARIGTPLGYESEPFNQPEFGAVVGMAELINNGLQDERVHGTASPLYRRLLVSAKEGKWGSNNRFEYVNRLVAKVGGWLGRHF